MLQYNLFYIKYLDYSIFLYFLKNNNNNKLITQLLYTYKKLINIWKQ